MGNKVLVRKTLGNDSQFTNIFHGPIIALYGNYRTQHLKIRLQNLK